MFGIKMPLERGRSTRQATSAVFRVKIPPPYRKLVVALKSRALNRPPCNLIIFS
jgi:hypothetical protein